MSLKKTLQKQSYDLIQGPVRNQDLLQIWKKKDLEKINILDPSISNVFDQEFTVKPFQNNALSISSTDKEEFDFNVGIGFVKNALIQFEIADFNLETHITGGKSVTVSYNNSFTKEISPFEIEKYLTKVNTDGLPPSTEKELNRNNLFVISGVVFAKNLNFTIDSDHAIDADVEANLNKVGKGKINLKQTGNHQIVLNSNVDEDFPVAVKAFRMHFAKGIFKKLELVTDNRNLF